MLDALLAEAARANGISPPSKTLLANHFLRWGKGCRYSAKALGDDGVYIHDFVTSEDIYRFHEQSEKLSPEQVQIRQQKIATARREAEADRQREYNEAADRAETLWRSLAESGKSEYLVKKQALAHDIRYGQGFIAVPVRDILGKIWSIQRIYDDASRPEHLQQQERNKDFLKGGRIRGCFHVIGIVANNGETYICEGYATGSTLHQATGKPVIICFSSGNIAPVTIAIKSAYPNLAVTIAADNDQWKEQNAGKKKAEETARINSCAVMLPKFPDSLHEQRPTDWNDLHVLAGLKEVQRQLLLPTSKIIESDADAIMRLAALPPMQYDRISKQEAQRLGVSKTTLDQEVKKKRYNKEGNAGGESVLFPDEDVWPEPTSPATLLAEITAVFRRFAILPTHADTALALWVAFTWCIDSVNVAPIMALSSPEKQCGKTTVLTMVSNLSARALPTANITPAALFRAIEAWQPTMIIDEADTFIRESDELRGVINSGHTRPTAFVIRTVGDEHEPKRFSTWGAKAIALIGKLPDTLHDRSIVIELRRKLAGESAEKLRYADQALFANLRSKLRRFSEDYGNTLLTIRPALPENISDRSADNWEPLLAIAQIAGQEWQAKAMSAARALSSRVNDASSLGTELLADIENIFIAKRCDKISSADLIDALCAEDERPWVTYNRGKQITPRQIARMLGEYAIHSKTIRLGYANTPKGFERNQFDDAFQRYLSATPENDATTPQSSKTNNFSVADKSNVADTQFHAATPEIRMNAHCGVVADENRTEVEI